MAPAGGRPSNDAFPFFNIQWGDGGQITAIGWSGQWHATLERSLNGAVALRGGMENCKLHLQPGEKIRMPRILALRWNGDRTRAHNQFRRLLLFEYAPRLDGRPVRLPIALQCYDRYNAARPDWGTEAIQLQAVRGAHDLGCDTLWLDAAWFEGGFPNGAGNWFCPPQRFPHGLKPISDACHDMDLKFMVWFEPERVAAGTKIARERPAFVIGGAAGGLYNLGNLAGRQEMTQLLSRSISESGIDIYRNDFNIDPLPFWRSVDKPGREGLTEIAYVDGHYSMWDDLLAQHPGLLIDNCASGGRRIDLETLSRSVPLWHSDSGCAPGRADWNQTQSWGLNMYVPLFSGCAWTPAAYDTRSAATAGLVCQFDFLNRDFPVAESRAALDEAKQNQKFYYGDFYPLTPCVPGPAALIAWQWHRSDLDSGILLAFRRAECPNSILQASLHALRANRKYRVEIIGETRVKTERVLTGKELMSLPQFHLPTPGTSLLVRYKPAR